MISVVIPAHNEEQRIGMCLRSLTRQMTKREFEVIVVDDDSSDDTATIAASFRDRLQLRVISIHGRRRGKARFIGCKAAEGDVIFCTDADASLPSDWIEQGIRTLESSRAIAATGPYMFNDLPMIPRTLFAIWLPLWIYGCRIIFGHYLLRGANFVITKEAYNAAGQFDPDADAHEDTDLSFRVGAIGRIAYDPHFSITASGRRFQNGLLRGGYEYLTGFVRRFVIGERTVQFSNAR